MPDCPRCRQPVDAQAIACPYCSNPLKAYGHPGITLHQAVGGEYLCQTCLYHVDDTCNFPQRPYAQNCTLYYDQSHPLVTEKPKLQSSRSFQAWFRRNGMWVVLGAIIFVSIMMALSGR
jgi:predicted amidophosphoribosyltransferase